MLQTSSAPSNLFCVHATEFFIRSTTSTWDRPIALRAMLSSRVRTHGYEKSTAGHHLIFSLWLSCLLCAAHGSLWQASSRASLSQCSTGLSAMEPPVACRQGRLRESPAALVVSQRRRLKARGVANRSRACVAAVQARRCPMNSENGADHG